MEQNVLQDMTLCPMVAHASESELASRISDDFGARATYFRMYSILFWTYLSAFQPC